MCMGGGGRSGPSQAERKAQAAMQAQALELQRQALEAQKAQLEEEKRKRQEAEDKKKAAAQEEIDRAEKVRSEGRLRLALDDTADPLVLGKPGATTDAAGGLDGAMPGKGTKKRLSVGGIGA